MTRLFATLLAAAALLALISGVLLHTGLDDMLGITAALVSFLLCTAAVMTALAARLRDQILPPPPASKRP